MTSLINTLKYYSPKTTTTMHLLPKTAVGTYAGLGAANYITEEIKRSKRKNEKLWAKRENNETNEE
jgi:hypothetical protein